MRCLTGRAHGECSMRVAFIMSHKQESVGMVAATPGAELAVSFQTLGLDVGCPACSSDFFFFQRNLLAYQYENAFWSFYNQLNDSKSFFLNRKSGVARFLYLYTCLSI